MSTDIQRRQFVSYFGALGFSSSPLPVVLWETLQAQGGQQITEQMLADAAAVTGYAFSAQQLGAMLEGVNENLTRYRDLRALRIDNSVAPPLYFNPVLPGMPIDRARVGIHISQAPPVVRPRNLEEVAHWPVLHLAHLVQSRQVRSIELTEMYLDRCRRLNGSLNCVVTLTEDRARRQARDADTEIAQGRYRGPLHGIPWGAKDIIAAKGYPTTWGAAPFKARVIDEDATVVARLDAAGAVMIAKLTTGELALDDIWFGGQTMNPWDLTMGSQGSSAGPASAVAGGLVAFAIGTETGGSIVEPSGVCGVTGLRPTFGRVSRHGVMALSWSLDKVGPMCRAVEDCAIVLNAIQGPDDQDLSLHDVPFNWDAAVDVRRLRVGYLKSAFSDTRQTPRTDANDAAALDKLRSLGISLVEVALPEHTPVDPLLVIYGEGNAALEDPVRAQPATLVRQDRVARQNSVVFLTASDYLNVNRLRASLMRKMADFMSSLDAYVVPFDYADYTPNPIATLNTAVTNLTGQPCVIVPHGFNEKGNPTSLTFVGRVFGEAPLLALAKRYQDSTPWHSKHPPL
jgi:Asp-tRNA(Asn)/Glu-tRNA(Gln) amidotransferase A subunit family amidase